MIGYVISIDGGHGQIPLRQIFGLCTLRAHGNQGIPGDYKVEYPRDGLGSTESLCVKRALRPCSERRKVHRRFWRYLVVEQSHQEHFVTASIASCSSVWKALAAFYTVDAVFWSGR
jgi:hypothetical protein